MYFTHKEKTVKNHTVREAVQQARTVLEHKGCANVDICTNAVRRYGDERTLITTQEMSMLVNEIVDDSIFYNVSTHSPSF